MSDETFVEEEEVFEENDPLEDETSVVNNDEVGEVYTNRIVKEILKAKVDEGGYLLLPNLTVDELTQIINERTANLDNSSKKSDIEQIVDEALAQYAGSINSEYYKNIHRRNGSKWKQSLEDTDGSSIRANKITPKDTNNPIELIRSDLNIGGKSHAPLYKSGFWITFRTPHDKEILDYEYQVSKDKVTLGRFTNGLIYSAVEAYQLENFIDFALSLAVNWTVNVPKAQDLKDLILITDIPVIAITIAASIYPKGYPLKQPCIADPDHCEDVVQELINLNNTIYVDNTRFTNGQIKHLKRKTHKHSVEKIKEYQDEFSDGDNSFYKLTDRSKITLSVPTVAAAIESSHSWISEINELANRAFTLPNENNKRAEYIRSQTTLTQLRQYSAWFKALEYEGDDGLLVETNRDKIDDFLESSPFKEGLTSSLFEKVKKYIDDSTVAYVAIPKYECPLCNKTPIVSNPKTNDLIPLDPLYVFFILRLQLLYKRASTMGV